MNVTLLENKFPLEIINLIWLLGWVHSNVINILIKQYRHIDIQERRPYDNGGGEESGASTSQVTRRRDKEDCSLEPSGRAQSCQHLDFKLLDSRIAREDICVVSSRWVETCCSNYENTHNPHVAGSRGWLPSFRGKLHSSLSLSHVCILSRNSDITFSWRLLPGTFLRIVSTHRSSWGQGLPQVLWMLQILSPWALSSSLSLHSPPSHKHLLESEAGPFLWAWIGSLKTQQTSRIQRTHNLTKIKPLIPSLCPIPSRSWLTLNTFSLSNQSAAFHGHRPHTHDFSMFHLESVTAAKLPQTQMFLPHLKYSLASHGP